MEGKWQRAVLLYMGRTGCIRSWRIVQEVTKGGSGSAPSSIARMWDSLLKRELVQPAKVEGVEVTWQFDRGNGRRLFVLSPTGQAWYLRETGNCPRDTELDWTLDHHISMRHAIAILETRDGLRGQGIEVIDNPLPCPVLAANPFGLRSEPDLVIRYRNRIFPVEVQREVSVRLLSKWFKSLELFQRLLLVTFTEASMERQRQRLVQARHKKLLPRALVLMTCLARLERGEREFLCL